MVIGRTGWSGELSYELYLQDRKLGNELFEIVHEAAKEFNASVIAPNTIRTIEGGLLSYQSDFGREHNPYTIGLDRLVDVDQDIDFIGKEALKKIKEDGIIIHNQTNIDLSVRNDNDQFYDSHNTYRLQAGHKINDRYKLKLSNELAHYNY